MATIKDIARLAGVSYSTVSKVINDYPDIGEDTRAKVLKIIKEQNFSPNNSARKLVTKKSRTIAVIMCGFDQLNENDIIPLQILKGVLISAQTINYEVAFYPITSFVQEQKSYAAFCRENNIEGAILSGIKTDDRYFHELIETNIPCVLIDVYAQGQNISSISVDNVDASLTAVEYLIKNNHKHIGVINGKLQSVVGLERYAGYCQALINNNFPLNKKYVVDGQFQEDIAYEQCKQLLLNNPEITALFCASDIMAIGAMQALRELNLKIPEDISIIGFDDVPLAKYLTPALTTIRQDFYKSGYDAMNLLIDLIEKKSEKGLHAFNSYDLIVRNSVMKNKKEY